jgi:hypothetical protein
MAWKQELREVLAGIPYSINNVFLHMDTALMPRNRALWASWNCLSSSGADSAEAAVCVTYWLNHLQNLPAVRLICLKMHTHKTTTLPNPPARWLLCPLLGNLSWFHTSINALFTKHFRTWLPHALVSRLKPTLV